MKTTVISDHFGEICEMLLAIRKSEFWLMANIAANQYEAAHKHADRIMWIAYRLEREAQELKNEHDEFVFPNGEGKAAKGFHKTTKEEATK